jgi:Family of unknown function (DUF6677)
LQPFEDFRFMPHASVSLKSPVKAAFLAWLVPGLGHFYQGRIGKGILYSTCILGLFFFGLFLGEGQNVYWRWVNPLSDPENFRLHYPGQFFAGLPALLALVQGTLASFGLDPILWGLMDKPSVEIINGLHPRLGKLVEVGAVYTTVAGLLNIFAIFDAYEGPAYTDDEPELEPEKAAKPLEGVTLEGQA